MLTKYAPPAFAIVVDALVVAIVCAALALAYWLVTGAGGEYLRLASDLIFYAGGIVLTLGALIELFRLKGTKEIRRVLYSPQHLFDGLDMVPVPEKDKSEGKSGAGWTLIFIGALLIAISFLFTLI
jgi:amino acid transporter